MESTVKVAHLILAHRNLGHLERTVAKLSHRDATVFIHLDAKAPLDSIVTKLAGSGQAILIKNRVNVKWGAFSMVMATLRAFEEILSHSQDYDFINLLSESDYPLADAQTFHDFLASHKGYSFVEYEQDGSPWIENAQTKVYRYHLVDYRFPGKYYLQDVINFLTPRRKMPLGLELVGRSQWFTMSSKHVKHVLEFTAQHPRVVRFFRHTWGPDEYYFQTILFNSIHRGHLVNDNLRYIDWSEGKHSPKTLTAADHHRVIQSGKFFARKFDVSVDSAILDKLDNIR